VGDCCGGGLNGGSQLPPDLPRARLRASPPRESFKRAAARRRTDITRKVRGHSRMTKVVTKTAPIIGPIGVFFVFTVNNEVIHRTTFPSNLNVLQRMTSLVTVETKIALHLLGVKSSKVGWMTTLVTVETKSALHLLVQHSEYRYFGDDLGHGGRGLPGVISYVTADFQELT